MWHHAVVLRGRKHFFLIGYRPKIRSRPREGRGRGGRGVGWLLGQKNVVVITPSLWSKVSVTTSIHVCCGLRDGCTIRWTLLCVAIVFTRSSLWRRTPASRAVGHTCTPSTFSEGSEGWGKHAREHLWPPKCLPKNERKDRARTSATNTAGKMLN